MSAAAPAVPAPPARKPYQVIVYVGANAPTVEGVRVVDLTAPSAAVEDVIALLTSSGLTASDLRSRALFLADDDPQYRDRALVAYSAMTGFARRRIDAAFDLEQPSIQLDQFDTVMRGRADAGRPEEYPAHAQAGGPARSDMPWVDLDKLSPQTVSAVRYARRLRWCPPASLVQALPQLVAIAAWRNRGSSDRFPFLTVGDEPLVEGESTVGVCLDTARRAAEAVRRERRAGNRDAVVPAVELTARQQRLIAAAAVPVRQTLARLEARSRVEMGPAHPDTPEFERGEQVEVEFWHCLKPENHTHGDAKPSAKVSAPRAGGQEGFRCFRCLSERADSLRLVMWAKSCSADEAADWLLGQ